MNLSSKNKKIPTFKIKEKIKLFLADDHVAIRDSLSEYLQEHGSFSVVGKTSNGAEVAPMVLDLKPDIVLLDIDMPKENGIYAAQRIYAKAPEIKIVIFSAYSDDSYKIRAALAGACEYIEKSDTLEATVNTLLKVYKQKENGLNRAMRQRLHILANSCTQEELIYNLTPSEVEVLDILKDGKEIKKAAALLNISLKTLESHLSQIYSKLNASNLREAIFLALQRNIILMR